MRPMKAGRPARVTQMSALKQSIPAQKQKGPQMMQKKLSENSPSRKAAEKSLGEAPKGMKNPKTKY